MWVPKLLLSPVKIRILCPKTTKFGPKLSFLVILVEALPALLVPCWWVGWWFLRAGCISQDTYLLYFRLNAQIQTSRYTNTNIKVHKYYFIITGVDHSSLNLCSMQTFLSLLLLLIAAIHSVNPDQRVIGLEDSTDYHVIMKTSDAT